MAIQFFARMRDLDDRVKSVMDDLHDSQAEYFNRGKKEGEPFAPGDKVWYRPPDNTGSPVDSRWLCPAVIKTREGKSSYRV